MWGFFDNLSAEEEEEGEGEEKKNLSLPVWTGSKGQIGSLFCKYFLTINNLYNGA